MPLDIENQLIPAPSGDVYIIVTNVTTGKPSYQKLSEIAIPSASSFSAYNLQSGCIVFATGPGCSFIRTNSSLWELSIPNGIEIYNFYINNTPSQGASASLTIKVAFSGSRIYNQDTSINMTDCHFPTFLCLRKIDPAIPVDIQWTYKVSSTGVIELSTTELSLLSGGGNVATTIKGAFI